jgi:hypothetical protein
LQVTETANPAAAQTPFIFSNGTGISKLALVFFRAMTVV